MNGSELLRVVDAIHRDKNIDKEVVFEGIEQAILSAARKHFGEEADVVVQIDRVSGHPTVTCDGQEVSSDVLGDLLGRVAAQTAKQVMIQKIREAERDSLFSDYSQLQGQIVSGTVASYVGGTATVNLGKVEGILPRGEQIPGESHRVGERVRAIVIEVRKAGPRVKIVLSRVHPDFVRRLFELEIPEIAERVIEIRSLAREAGYRTKVAVSCFDQKVDCIGACVGVRGARIRNITDELGGERIDIVRWNDSLQVLVPNALQPAEVEDVILCPMLGRVIVLAGDDQLSLAIGRRGQNVRLASKLVGWDIEIMPRSELDEQLERSVEAFSRIPNVPEDLPENLVAQGFFTFDDLSIIEPDHLSELGGGLTPEQCDEIIAFADDESARLEEQTKLEKQQREERRMAQAEQDQEKHPRRRFTTLPVTPGQEEAKPTEANDADNAAESVNPAESAVTEPAAEQAASEGETVAPVETGEPSETGESAESNEASETAVSQGGAPEEIS